MIQIQFNLLAVLIAAIASFAIGALWYSPLLFGKTWMRLAGIKNMKGRAGSYIIGFITTLVTAYILAFGIAYTQAATIPEGLIVGALVWVGFIATISMGMLIYEGKPVKLYFINNAYHLLSLLVMSAIIIAFQ
ncbi:MAG: DUF1761 domain-containing protein [Nanoarchaeota archaeon]